MIPAPTTVCLLLTLMLMGAPVRSWAQDGNDLRTYGTKDRTFHSISAWAFTGLTGSDYPVTQTNADFERYCSATCILVAPLMLPQGVGIFDFQLSACNQHSGVVITARVLRKPRFHGAAVELASLDFGAQSTPDACNGMAVQFPFPTVINNALNTYFIQVVIRGGDIRTRFDSVMVSYSLQVSPAPAVATFGDVPTNHPFFQFIEALVAAGITSGCNVSPPMYCPDAAVTRGQMAVFISKALGLHFAP